MVRACARPDRVVVPFTQAEQGDCSSTPEPHDSSNQHLCIQESSSRQPCEIEASDEHLCEKDSSDSQNHAGVLPPPKQYVDFKVIYNKTKYDINFAVDDTVVQLKQYLQDVIVASISHSEKYIFQLRTSYNTVKSLHLVPIGHLFKRVSGMGSLCVFTVVPTGCLVPVVLSRSFINVTLVPGVPQAMQKVMIKGLAKDERTLRDLGVVKGAKVMVVGSKLDDVLAVSTPSKQVLQDEKSAVSTKEPFCKQKQHRKVLDKGIPDDVMPGIKNTKEMLPLVPLSGMLNKSGGKVRLTFKMEQDQVWIGTKERTDKIPMSSIKGVVSEPIEGHEEYHIMGIQLGPTEASRYWVYWVPVQFIDAIKDAILGKWQYF
uniref:UBFD1 PH-like C-terminal domain-containing protein n=1 Tax=Timema monikensis TaxID=170555 RepID=A0A7R9EAK1_9NEOP|nr:unnamed protein product [Timema monikensis]